MGAQCSKPKNVGNPQVRTLNKLPTPDSKNQDSNQEINHNEKSEEKSPTKKGPNNRYVDNKWNYLSPQKTNNQIENESPNKPAEKPVDIVQTKSTQNTPDVSFLSEDNTAPLTRKTMKYKKGPFIGKGSSSDVFECFSLLSGELLALKLSKIYGDSLKIATYLESLKKDFISLKNLNHNNIIKFHGCEIVEVKNEFTIVEVILEYISGGSIRGLIDKYGSIDEKIVAQYTRQILKGLAFLHFHGILHKDLKCTNILIDSLGKIKLTDYSFTRLPEHVTGDMNDKKYYVQSSGFWMAPEILQGKGYGKPGDVWSLGCTMIEMLTGKDPWNGMANKLDEIAKLMNSKCNKLSCTSKKLVMPPFPKGLSENMRDFLTSVFQYEPDSRPTVLELLAHPLIKEIDFDNDTSRLIDMDYNEIKISEQTRSPPLGGTMRSNTFDPLNSSLQKKTEIAPKKVQLVEANTNQAMMTSYSPPKKLVTEENNKLSYGRLKTNDITLNTSVREENPEEFARYFETEKSIIKETTVEYPGLMGSKKTLDSEFMTPRKENMESAIYEENQGEMMYSSNRKNRRFDPQEIPIETPLSRKLREEKEKKDQEIENDRQQKKKLWESELKEELSRLNINKVKKF